MSLHQALVASKQDYDVFAPSWQAGVSGSQCLRKTLKKCDIESVNVVEICENLCLAVYENSKSNHESSHRVEDEESQSTVRCSQIPFRAFSNIWFGTLKIYQQQVNTLFRLSQDLFSRSCDYDVKHLEAYKRKSSLTSQKLAKKRRLTLRESTERTYLTTNYSQLLDDLEKLAEEPAQNPLPEISESISAPITQVRIREITIREISATAHTSPDELDEDSGFGEATHEEIADFFNFVEDNSMLNFKKIPTKRKSTCERGSPIKKSCCVNDFSFEPLNNFPLCKNVLETSSLKRSITPTLTALDENKIMENVHGLQQQFIATTDSLETDNIKKENLSFIENTQITKHLLAKKERKLIIDECMKIDVLENIKEMKVSDLSIIGPRKRTLRSLKSKRNITAFALLTRFNRRSLKLSLSRKQKFYLSRKQFQRDFLNLLREIFKTNFNEKYASEIYPKWKYFEDEVLKQNKKERRNKSIKQINFIIQPEADVNNLNAIRSADVVDNNHYNEYQESHTTINNNMETLNNCIRNEWRPYGVMFKLLNLWRFSQTNKIAAITLFKLAENQIDRALGFNSLLNLSKKQFVNLTSFPEAIELQNILVGKAVKFN